MNSQEIITDIRNIYARFPIPTNLQQHLFRVAAVCALMCDHWTGSPIRKEDAVALGLIHDLGNIVKFDFKNEDLLDADSRSDLAGWKKRQQETIAKYGADATAATVAMVRQIGIPVPLIDAVENSKFTDMPRILAGKHWESKMMKYADLRVGPFGVISLAERIEDFNQRYKNKHDFTSPETIAAIKASFELEKQLLTQTTLSAEHINDKTIQKYVDSF